VSGTTQSFAYHRSLAPMMWVLVGLSVVELCVVHLLVALLWSPLAAALLSLATLAGLAWLVAAIRSFRRLPVLVDERRVLLRAGRIKSIAVERAGIAGLRGDITAAEAKERDVLNLALLAHPNIVIDFAAPVERGRGRKVRAVAHRLDDAGAFLAALSARPVAPLP
jgi:hypothetical protein